LPPKTREGSLLVVTTIRDQVDGVPLEQHLTSKGCFIEGINSVKWSGSGMAVALDPQIAGQPPIRSSCNHTRVISTHRGDQGTCAVVLCIRLRIYCRGWGLNDSKKTAIPSENESFIVGTVFPWPQSDRQAAFGRPTERISFPDRRWLRLMMTIRVCRGGNPTIASVPV
jgi:hypothetical protein